MLLSRQVEISFANRLPIGPIKMLAIPEWPNCPSNPIKTRPPQRQQGRAINIFLHLQGFPLATRMARSIEAPISLRPSSGIASGSRTTQRKSPVHQHISRTNSIARTNRTNPTTPIATLVRRLSRMSGIGISWFPKVLPIQKSGPVPARLRCCHPANRPRRPLAQPTRFAFRI